MELQILRFHEFEHYIFGGKSVCERDNLLSVQLKKKYFKNDNLNINYTKTLFTKTVRVDSASGYTKEFQCFTIRGRISLQYILEYLDCTKPNEKNIL